MKFENPIMNISMFEVADIITTSGEDVLNSENTATIYAAGLKNSKAVTEVLSFTFTEKNN